MSAITPGRLGTATRSSRTGPPARPASSSVRAAARRPRLPGDQASPVVERRAPHAASSCSIAPSTCVEQRLAVGAVDRRPRSRGWRRRRAWRRGSSGRSPACARRRARRPPARRARWRARAAGGRRRPSCGRGSSASTTSGRAPMPVTQPVQRARAARRCVVALRRQVPGGAVEEVLARVLDARDLRARQRMAADEARVLPRPRRRPRAWSSRRR